MPEVLFPRQEIKVLTRKLREARLKEHKLAKEVNDAKAPLEREKAVVIQAAYKAEAIDKKNKDTRAAGEAAALAEDAEVFELEQTVAALEWKQTLAKLDRQALEDEVSLTRAWLYSQSRIPS